ncbi:MAG: aldo/keto reductase, partial [Oceanospirillaceae bacterium]|nr:aldo/keto reductase [Oceanospirillaceae bacterium]
DQFCTLAKELGHSPAQLTLAWLLNKGDDLIPIPGTTNLEHLAENASASEIRLTSAEINQIETVLHPNRIKGERYPAAGMREIDSEN